MNIRYIKALVLFLLAASGSVALADPPGRVGRIAYVQGDVVFRNNVDDDSIAAQINWPVTSQNLITTARNARAEVRVGSAAVRVDADSELEVSQLDDEHFNLRLIYGSADIRIRSTELAQQFSIFTSQAQVRITEPGRFRIDTERAPDTTALDVLDGAARLTGTRSTFVVRAGKRAEIVDDDIRMTTLLPNDLQTDFDLWATTRDRRDEQSQTVRYISPETTGYEELGNYGNWETTTEYGAIWYPRVVTSDWAPYRVGRWTWVEPWGWTWVDSAPWGYAPFHYGRWVWFHQRWCWAPGAVVARPVWAPAMVGWVGGAHWNVAFSAGAAPAVGWFPLAPREVYVPSYRASPTYIRQVNITHVTNISNVTVINGFASAPHDAHYQNREVHNAVSVMPHDQFVARRTVIVSSTPEHLRSRGVLENAPVSAIAPASIAHPNGFVHDGTRAHNILPRPTVTPEQPNRFGQSVPPTVRDGVPPTVRVPMTQDRNEPRVLRNADVQIERRGAPAVPPPPQLAAPPSTHTQPNPGPELGRRNEVHTDRHIEPPNVRDPVRDTPRVMPQPNPAQDAERERARQAHEAQRQAEAQARALREQQNIQPPQPPLKQTTPPAVKPGQEDRRHHWQENAPAEMRREEHPGSIKDGKESGRHPDEKENMGRR